MCKYLVLVILSSLYTGNYAKWYTHIIYVSEQPYEVDSILFEKNLLNVYKAPSIVLDTAVQQ